MASRKLWNIIFIFSAAFGEAASATLERADALFEATLYAEAAPLYEELLIDAHTDEQTSQLRLRLAQALFLTENYWKAALVLQGERASPPALQLSAAAYRRLGNYQMAVETLNKYLNSASFHDEAEFELALTYFLWGKTNDSKLHFTRTAKESSNEPLRNLSTLYLARIANAEGNPAEASRILNSLALLIPKGHLLRYELAYLQGEAAFQAQDYVKAANFFEQAIPKRNQSRAPWYHDTLYRLGWSHLSAADDPTQDSAFQRHHFEKAEKVFKTLSTTSPDEKVSLALSQCYLAKAGRLKDEDAYRKAEALLTASENFVSRDGKAHALLLRAEAAPSYSEREKLFRQLIQEGSSGSQFFSKILYLKGLNDYEEGLTLLASGKKEEATKVFDQAAASLARAAALFSNDEKGRNNALKYQALSYYHQKNREGYVAALGILDKMIESNGSTLSDEIFYFRALVATLLGQDGVATLMQSLQTHPQGKYADASWNLLGVIAFQKGNYSGALHSFTALAEHHPASPLAGEALFWCAVCSEKMNENPDVARHYRKRVFEEYPNSLYAGEAYFRYYTYNEYLQGDRSAIKHLQAFAELFPDSPYLINAYYLMGLDHKRDRKTPEGKWISKRNLTAAIDSFHEVESHFETLNQNGRIPSEEMEYFTNVKYRSHLERALANLAIAEESHGAKKRIYLDYAEEEFFRIVQDFDTSERKTDLLTRNEPYPAILEESSFWLARTYIKNKDDDAAEKTLNGMLEKYRSAKITRGYFLSRVWYELGMIDMRRQKYEHALENFALAEDSAKGRLLSTDQKLDLWIQQSLCYKAMNQTEKAMLILSKVINNDAISSLRMKAMYLRADIYEQQGRPELARKQLQATSKGGGEWALKAKKKLEENYGYH